MIWYSTDTHTSLSCNCNNKIDGHSYIVTIYNIIFGGITINVFHQHYWYLEADNNKVISQQKWIKTYLKDCIPPLRRKNTAYAAAVSSNNSDSLLLKLITRLHNIIHDNNTHCHPYPTTTGYFLAKYYS